MVVPLRIDIHVGELIVKKGDIINLASRIESLGITGAKSIHPNVEF